MTFDLDEELAKLIEAARKEGWGEDDIAYALERALEPFDELG